MDDLEQLKDPHNWATCSLFSGLASRQSVTPEWRPQGQCPDWTRQVFCVGAPIEESRWRNKFQKLCSYLRELLFPRGSVGVLCRVFFAWLGFSSVLELRSFLLVSSCGRRPHPKKTEHLRRQPPSSYSVSEYVATYIGGNAGMPIVFCTVQFLSAFSPSSILAYEFAGRCS